MGLDEDGGTPPGCAGLGHRIGGCAGLGHRIGGCAASLGHRIAGLRPAR
jgi:hypothetical protein